MSTSPETQTPRRSRWKRLFLWSLAFVGVAAAGCLLLAWWAGRDLEAALAEADRDDPGWRLEELEAARAEVPDAENSALRVLAAKKLLPIVWPTWPAELTQQGADAPEKVLANLPSVEPLKAVHVEALSAALAQAAPALAEARKLSDLPRGRFPFLIAAHEIWPSPLHLRTVDDIVRLLGYDVLLQAQRQDMDGALASCRGIVNAARALGDEPSVFAQGRRLEHRGTACKKIERVLAQGEPSDAALAALATLLADEEAQPLFLQGARADRATFHRMFESLKSAEFRSKQGEGLLLDMLALSGMRADHAGSLKLGNEIVQIARRPLEEREPLVDKALSTRLPLFADIYILPKIQKATAEFHGNELRTRAALRCVLTALAAERHRRAQGVWPAKLETLVPRHLEAQLLDPYDSQPLRLKRLPDGLVIYSIGADRQDNAGAFDATRPFAPGNDVTFRLWDAPARRQRQGR